MTEDVYHDCRACNRYPGDSSDEGACLAVTDTNGIGLTTATCVADIDIVISCGERHAGSDSHSDVI